MSEPVTWATEDLEDVMSPRYRQMHMDAKSSTWKQFPIPLYTHPMRELTDEEINEAKIDAVQEYYKVFPKVVIYTPIFFDELFARALLKKASEK